jgi:3-oxoacyl-[acyl-carrier protein] reductase
MRLEGSVALITGSSKGIGRAIALTLAQQGVRVVLSYHDRESHAQQTRTIFERAGVDFLLVKSNLVDADNAVQLVQQTLAHFGQLDILVNNLERGGWPIIHGALSPEQWDVEVDTTLKSKFLCYRAAQHHLQQRPQGCVLNIASIAALTGRRHLYGQIFADAYSAAAAGILTLTQNWARDMAPHVRVNCLMLGLIETRHGPHTLGWRTLSEDTRSAIVQHTPLQRLGTLDDVARAALFLIRDATFMTGQTLVLDGGISLVL